MRRLLILFILCFSGLAGKCPEYKALYIQKEYAINHIDWQDIDLLMKKYRIYYPSIVKAQISLETGYLKSVLCKTNKNLFGMRYAPQRETTAIGSMYEHAIYNSYEDCIRDYKTWQSLYYKGGDYYSFLQRIGYAEDKSYINKLKSILK